MKKNIMKKWVKALRSGKYKQGKNFLKQFNSKKQPRHCCLGVLCELYNEEMKKNHKKSLVVDTTRSGSFGTVCFFGTNDSTLPKVVRDWSGVRDHTGVFGIDVDGSCLANLNDDGKTFKTISNIIEKNWENL